MSINGLIAKKLGMTEVYGTDGKKIAVTVLEAGPCRVVQKRTQETDGYEALQLAFDERPEKRMKKPDLGHFKKVKAPPARTLREFSADIKAFELGAVVKADIFQAGDRIDATGVSKGKGFQGVMKRHHFAGGPATHGSMFHREPGSIGASSFPSRVWKNQKMPGHMGAERVTVKNLEVVEVRVDQNLVFVRGAVPGSPGTVILLRKIKPKVKAKA